MRSTVEITPELIKRVRKHMKRHKKTFRELVEDGLRRVIDEPRSSPFQFPNACFDGEPGFQDGVSEREVSEFIRQFNEPHLP